MTTDVASNTLPIVLDTDVGTNVDDAVAIGLVCASPELDLRAVTTVSGDTERRARIAARLLALGGLGHVPVAAGERDTRSRRATFRPLDQKSLDLVDDAATIASADAVDVLIETARRERPHLVAIGPLTNLAAAIDREPTIVEAIAHLTVMGGRLEPDPEAPAEYNLGVDPEASLAVLSSRIPTTLVPLDVTEHVELTTGDVATLRAGGSALVQVLCDLVDAQAAARRASGRPHRMRDPDALAVLHDPLTVAVLQDRPLDRSLVTWARMRLRPAIVDGTFRLVRDGAGREMDVAVTVEARSAVGTIVARLLALPS
jgi:purine nucleosidase